MSGGQVVTVAPHSELAEGVISLSKRHQDRLGQLPFAAFHRAASQGALLAVENAGVVTGYALYRRQRRTGVVKLTHLCVDPAARGDGVARSLIEAISDQNPISPGIGLWCREDYEATGIWPELGFGREGERPARAAGRTLVHWWRPIDDRTLFTFVAEFEDRPAAAIDSNVFRDLHQPRPEFAASLALQDDWLIDSIELVITPQLETEIREAPDDVGACVNALSQYRRLSQSGSSVQSAFDRLRSLLVSPDIKGKDQRHLAMASVGNARYFVTRDRDVCSHAEAVEEATGLIVLKPEDLLLRLHAEQHEDEYKPAAILETNARVRQLESVPTRETLTRFVEPSLAERARDLHSRFEAVAAVVGSGGELNAIEIGDEGPLALAAFTTRQAKITVDVLRVSQAAHRVTFARQFLHLLRERAVSELCSAVVVSDTVTEYGRVALVAEGFVEEGDKWVARLETGVTTWSSSDIASMREELGGGEIPDALVISEAERRRWPASFISGRVPVYAIPIRPAWARALFDADPPQGTLLQRPMSLGLAREHVYYRSYRKTLKFPARILWYVSGGGPNSGFRAASWLDAVVSGRPRSLFQRLGAQGIYSREDVEGCAQPGGNATALLFSRTEVFGRSVSLASARTIWEPLNRNGALQTMVEMDEQAFSQIYTEGSR